MKKVGFILLGSVLLLSLCLVSTASAKRPSCDQFYLIQTYDGSGFYQAPAWYYGETVTIAYEARNCNFFQESQGHFVLHLDGTATVYAGSSAEGEPIDVRGFHSTETWHDPENTQGWPLTWWDCSVKQAHYKWKIPSVYDFTVQAHDGFWSYEQTAFTKPPQQSSGEFDACQ